jgi:hypothetical protein
MNMPMFSAEESLYRSASYRTGTVCLSSALSHLIVPQAFLLGGGGFGGSPVGLDPLPPECSKCQWTCTVVSCGPGCRMEKCGDVCTSVPCALA